MPQSAAVDGERSISPERACEPVASRGYSLRRKAGEADPLSPKGTPQACAYTSTLNGACAEGIGGTGKEGKAGVALHGESGWWMQQIRVLLCMPELWNDVGRVGECASDKDATSTWKLLYLSWE
jgi:hypothetical protein